MKLVYAASSAFLFLFTFLFSPLPAAFSSYTFQAAQEQLENEYFNFLVQNGEWTGLISFEDLRTPRQRKLLEKAKLDSRERALAVEQMKRKLDKLQKKLRNVLLLNAIQASPKQFPKVYKLAKQAAASLELTGSFNIFIISSPEINAFTYSYNPKDFDIVLHSALLDALNEDELLAILAHEMGHVKDQAILLKLLLAVQFESTSKKPDPSAHAEFYISIFQDFPAKIRELFVALAQEAVGEGLELPKILEAPEAKELSRNMETTADRAAVLVLDGEKIPMKALAALAYGGSKSLSAEFNLEELMKQINEALSTIGTAEEMDELLSLQGAHPFDVIRLIQIQEFSRSKTFLELRSKLDQDPFGRELDAFKVLALRRSDFINAYEKYKTTNGETDEPIVRLKTEKRFTDQIVGSTQALRSLTELILSQLNRSNLLLAENELFGILIEKLHGDDEDFLKKLLVPSVVELLKSKLKTLSSTKAPGAASTPTEEELQRKLEEIEVFLKLVQGERR